MIRISRRRALIPTQRRLQPFAHAGKGPVLDIGCGTGLVGEVLAARPVDGVDISPEMLAKARAQGCYRGRSLRILKTLAIDDDAYRGLVNAGTFTHGHVGAEALDELVRIAARSVDGAGRARRNLRLNGLRGDAGAACGSGRCHGPKFTPSGSMPSTPVITPRIGPAPCSSAGYDAPHIFVISRAVLPSVIRSGLTGSA